MLNKLKKYTTLDSTDKRLFLEAYFTLGLMRFAILTLSFKRLVATLNHNKHTTKLPPLIGAEYFIAQAISRAINRAANHTLWESACLAQALTAQRMLQKRNIPGAFYLGVLNNNESKQKLRAHAWSKCGDIFITGVEGHEAFTVLSVFAWGKQ